MHLKGLADQRFEILRTLASNAISDAQIWERIRGEIARDEERAAELAAMSYQPFDDPFADAPPFA